MLPDRVSNPGPLTYESGALPIALRGPASYESYYTEKDSSYCKIISTACPVPGPIYMYMFKIMRKHI